MSKKLKWFIKILLILLLTCGIFISNQILTEAQVNTKASSKALYFYQIAEKYKKQKSYPEEASVKIVISNYNKAIALNPKYLDAYLGLADAYFYQYNYTKANECIQKALKIAPRSKQNLLKIAKIYSFRRDDDKARVYINKALAIDPHYAEAYYLLAELEPYGSDLTEEYYKKALNYNLNSQDAYNAYNKLAMMNDDINISNSYALKMHSLNPKETDGYMIIARNYAGINEYEKAIYYYKKVLELNKHLENINATIAQQYYYLEDYNNAIIYFEDEVKYGNKSDGLDGLSNSYEKLGNTSKAKYYKDLYEDNKPGSWHTPYLY